MGSCASCANKDKCSSASKDGGCSSSVKKKKKCYRCYKW